MEEESAEPKLVDLYRLKLVELQSKLGEKTMLFMECGGFYEVYEAPHVEIDASMQLVTCRDVLNLAIARKHSKRNGFTTYQAGVPTHAIRRHCARLLRHGFNVVLMQQTAAPEKRTMAREIAEIMTPGLTVLEDDDDEVALLVLTLDFTHTQASACALYAQLGVIRPHTRPEADNVAQMTDSAREIVASVEPAEVVVHTIGAPADMCGDALVGALGATNLPCTVSALDAKHASMRASYQDQLLRSTFATDASLFESIRSRLEWDGASTCLLGTLIRLIDHVRVRDAELLYGLTLYPAGASDDREHLQMHNDAARQFGIFKQNDEQRHSLFSFCRHTRTRMGARLLRERFKRPLVCASRIRLRLDLVDVVLRHRDRAHELLRLDDGEALYRRMSLRRLSVRDVPRVHDFHTGAIALAVEAADWGLPDMAELAWASAHTNALEAVRDEWQNLFDGEACAHNTYDQAIFRGGVDAEIDAKRAALYECRRSILGLVSALDATTGVLCTFRDETATVELTRPRATRMQAALLQAISHATPPVKVQELWDGVMVTDVRIETSGKNKSVCTVECKWLVARAAEYLSLRADMVARTEDHFRATTRDFFARHKDVIASATRFAACVDVAFASAHLHRHHRFRRPDVRDAAGGSEVSATQLRHPIIEHLVQRQRQAYVTNDIALSGTNALVLYGINSVGKSSLLKAVGIAVILAQSGCYVPADSLQLVPFTQLFTRSGNEDNLVHGHSSYSHECAEMKRIWHRADGRSLVLTDEMATSTEHESALRVVTAFVFGMSRRSVPFAFVTHMLDLDERIASLRTVRRKHMRVDSEPDGTLTFYRTLADGPPSQRLYGVTIAANILNDASFTALTRSLFFTAASRKRPAKPSAYNAAVWRDECEVCGFMPTHDQLPLESHHVVPRASADSRGCIGQVDIHAGDLIATLCDECHDRVHSDKLHILGRRTTDRGTRLMWHFT